MIESLLVPTDEARNEHKRLQLRELAALNGKPPLLTVWLADPALRLSLLWCSCTLQLQDKSLSCCCTCRNIKGRPALLLVWPRRSSSV